MTAKNRFAVWFNFLILSLMFVGFQNCGSGYDSQTGGDASQAEGQGEIIIFGKSSNGEIIKESVVYELLGGKAIIYGDIIVGEDPAVSGQNTFMVAENGSFEAIRGVDDLPVSTSGHFWGGEKWPKGNVSFAMEEQFPNTARDRVLQAVRRLNSSFNRNGIGINIREVDPENTNEQAYILLQFENHGCAADLGYKRQVRGIFLSKFCSVGNIMHEFLHSIGMSHEHQRADRDRFIQIHSENIRSGRARNFQKSKIMANTIGTYDVGSIMHYPATAFAKESGLATIELLPRYSHLEGVMGQRGGLSKQDVRSLKRLYP